MKKESSNINVIINKIRRGYAVSGADQIELKKALRAAICDKHSEKMAGLQSLSTSVKLNKQCAKNAAVDGSICSHCYACKLLNIRSTLEEKLKGNTDLLTRVILPAEVLPEILTLYFRFEAFGDLNNEIQVVNYFNICKKNPAVNFAIWTKNPRFIDKAIKNYGIAKPENLVIVYSSLFVNQVGAEIMKKYSFINKVFTVYSADYIKENNININCGARSCAGCLRCYKKRYRDPDL